MYRSSHSLCLHLATLLALGAAVVDDVAAQDYPPLASPRNLWGASSQEVAPASGLWSVNDATGDVGCAASCGGDVWGGDLCGDFCCRPYGSAWENTLFFAAADGWRTRLDDDDSNNFGFRNGFNTGIGWWDCPVRIQVGGSYGGYDLDGRDAAARTSTNSVEEQAFATAGVYKRSDVCNGDCLSWGVVYDFMYDDHFGEAAEEIKLTQIRFQTGWALGECDEIGVWGAFRTNRDNYLTDISGVVCVNSLDQASLFWHHTWKYGGDTTAYWGWAEDPGEWVFGLNGQAPLSDAIGLFGSAVYIVPSTRAGDSGDFEEYSEQYWNVSFGLVWYPGCKAFSPNVSGHTGLPLLPVADNGTFAVDAPVGNL